MPTPFTSPAPDICTSHEAARQLKAAGFPQDSTYFYWVDDMLVARQTLAYMGQYHANEEAIAAPTAEEILRRLPYSITEDRNGNLTICDLTVRPVLDGGWAVFYKRRAKRRPKLCSESGDTLANAAAAMYCYLSDNNLLPE